MESRSHVDRRQVYAGGIGSGQGGAPLPTGRNAEQEPATAQPTDEDGYFELYLKEHLADADARYRIWRDQESASLWAEYASFKQTKSPTATNKSPLG
jgi:hypothetical protein